MILEQCWYIQHTSEFITLSKVSQGIQIMTFPFSIIMIIKKIILKSFNMKENYTNFEQNGID